MNIIVEEQIILQQEIEMLKQTNKRLNEQKKGISCYGTRPGDSDYDIIEEIEANTRQIKEIEYILSTSKMITNPNSRKIVVGTKFKLFIKYEKDDTDILEAVLIEKKEIKGRMIPSIEKESKLGQAIFQKEVGDSFRYYDQEGSKVSGKVICLEFERPEIGKTYVYAKKTTN